jgi:hypothetical protein
MRACAGGTVEESGMDGVVLAGALMVSKGAN